MTTRPLFRRLAIAIAGIGLVAAAVITVSALRPTPSQPIAQPEGPVTVGDAAGGTRVLVFGDSWTYGMAATQPTGGYAYRLSSIGGWQVTVAGEPGSGYLKPGWWGRTFGERLETIDASVDPDLIVLQGSINDRRQPAAGYRDAVTEAWDTVSERFPDAQVLVLGPAPQVLPVQKATARIDSDLAALAAERGWPYVSPIGEDWITEANYAEVIDSSDFGRDHPSDDGHRYLAEKVAAAIRPLLPQVPVEAVTEQPEPVLGD